MSDNERSMLEIVGLHADVEGEEILKGVDLKVGAGEVHAIMGPNGSGKSTLSRVLAGEETYEITAGQIFYKGKNLLTSGYEGGPLHPDERACEGIFLAFQYPVEVPGITNAYFLRAALNAQRRYRGEDELDPMDFLTIAKERIKLVGLEEGFLNRNVNEGFSGGEKKRNEIFHLAVLEPKLAILDETDSGLDIDSFKLVADAVNKLRTPDRAFILVTHYEKLLNFITPDRVHVMLDGRFVKSGGIELARKLEEGGYAALEQELAASQTA